ncbi:dockerin type I domain-containing protein [Ruminococcus sp.]|uniref:dockerin type I domain-containing protein n=1 Tax=Ruminococcus sp. TaxID=41978 RepID=UPI0025FE8C7F|nr:dockerin type I domain-containing protein [Ruminococcus sp.]
MMNRKKLASCVLSLCVLANAAGSLSASAITAPKPEKYTTLPPTTCRNNSVLYLDRSSILRNKSFTIDLSSADGKVYYYDKGRNIKIVSHNDRGVPDAKNADAIQSRNGLDKSRRDVYDAMMYNAGKAYDFYVALGFRYNYTDDDTIYLGLMDGSSAYDVKNSAFSQNGSILLGAGEVIPRYQAGSVSSCNTLATDIDVVTHEFTHLVLQYKLGWDNGSSYETQSIMEGYCDIMGELNDDTREWRIGTDHQYWNIKYNTKLLCMRDLRDPKAANTGSGEYIDFFTTYPEYRSKSKSSNIQGSTVLSHIAYLMNLNGVPVEDQALIWYTSMEELKDISPDLDNVTFPDVRIAVSAANEHLFSGTSKYYGYDRAISRAFDDAEIYPCGDVNEDGTVDGYDLNMLTNHVNGSAYIGSDTGRKAADYNCDGVINSADVQELTSRLRTSVTQKQAEDQSYMDEFMNGENNNWIDGVNRWDINNYKKFVNFPGGDRPLCDHAGGHSFCAGIPTTTRVANGYVRMSYENEEPYFQCAGFARQKQMQYFGTSKTIQLCVDDTYVPRIGDHIRSGGHSVFVTSVTDNHDGTYSVKFADCNAVVNCLARKDVSGTVTTDNYNYTSSFRDLSLRTPEERIEWVERPVKVGDLTGDSVVDNVDLSQLANIQNMSYIGMNVSMFNRAADVNLDGSVDSRDYRALRSYLSGRGEDLGYVR